MTIVRCLIRTTTFYYYDDEQDSDFNPDAQFGAIYNHNYGRYERNYKATTATSFRIKMSDTDTYEYVDEMDLTIMYSFRAFFPYIVGPLPL